MTFRSWEIVNEYSNEQSMNAPVTSEPLALLRQIPEQSPAAKPKIRHLVVSPPSDSGEQQCSLSILPWLLEVAKSMEILSNGPFHPKGSIQTFCEC